VTKGTGHTKTDSTRYITQSKTVLTDVFGTDIVVSNLNVNLYHKTPNFVNIVS
jgi:hypothetical protein